MALDVGPPPVPPRPHSAGSYHVDQPIRSSSVPPPIPPLPPDFRPHAEDMYRPYPAQPLFAPQPQQPIRDLRLNLPHALDERFGVSYNGVARFASPPLGNGQKIQAQMMNSMPGFIAFDESSHRRPSPALSPPPFLPPPSLPTGAAWHGEPDIGMVAARLASTSLNTPPPTRFQSVHGVVEYPKLPPPPPLVSSSPPRPLLAAPLPNIRTLQNALDSVQSPTANVTNRVAWIRDVLLLVSRASLADGNGSSSSASPMAQNSLPSGPIKISDPVLQDLAHSAVHLLISIVPTLPKRSEKLIPPIAEALYIRATLTASGAFPDYIPASPRNAFREFEISARAGFSHAWFRVGRDYEGFDDAAHARQCFERGASMGDAGCLYRLGMAQLLGQLNFPANSAEGAESAAELLHRAATLATVDFAHPAYVFALFLLDDFDKVSIPPHVLASHVPTGSGILQEARRHLERSAFLNFAPAQQRIGRAYEFAEAPFPFDPNLSVEYYSMASAGGDAQADLALSKWYLCGAERYFDKDEMRARDYAERAAARGLPAAKFAMGYYYEVGIGMPSDINRARQWYEDAAALGDAEAVERLKVLADTAVPLSREQHDTLAETRLVRTRTKARMRSDVAATINGPPLGQGVVPQQQRIVFQRRQASLPSHMPAPDQYASAVHPAHHRQPPQGSSVLPPRRTGSHADAVDYGSLPYVPQRLQQQLVDRPRYSLVDPGATGGTSSPPPLRSASAGTPLPPMRRQHTGQASISFSPRVSPRGSPRGAMSALPSDTESSATLPSTGRTRYNTFAEMGIEGKRAEDKECIIM